MENMNTLEVYTALKKAKFTEMQSKELATLFGKYSESEPASKRDLSETELRIIKEIKDLDVKLSMDIKNLDIKLSTDIKNLDMKLSTDIKELDVKLTKDMKELDVKLSVSIEKVRTDLVRWIIGMVFASGGLLAAFLKLVN